MYTNILSKLSKLCHIIHAVTGLNTALFDHDFNSLIVLKNKDYPFLTHEIYQSYQQEVFHHLGHLHHSASYLHPLPEGAFIYYDIRLQITDDVIFYACIGPILSELYSEQLVLSIMYQLKIPLSKKEYFFEFYREIPYLSKQTSYALWLSYHLLTTMPEVDLSSMSLPTLQTAYEHSAVPHQLSMQLSPSDSEIQLNYLHELQWRSAVSHGDVKSAQKAFSKMAINAFSYRMPKHPLRTQKNTLCSLNALCRGAAIDGGADAIAVHHTHELFAMRIENAKNTLEIMILSHELFVPYCKLVIKSRTKNFSPIVAKAISYLYAHYDEALSLHIVAHKIHCSEGHLSRTFQKETGKTLGNYLNELRITQAISMLKIPSQSISDIALAVGFSSYNKFSIEFKKYTGKSATQYMKDAHQ